MPDGMKCHISFRGPAVVSVYIYAIKNFNKLPCKYLPAFNFCSTEKIGNVLQLNTVGLTANIYGDL